LYTTIASAGAVFTRYRRQTSTRYQELAIAEYNEIATVAASRFISATSLDS